MAAMILSCIQTVPGRGYRFTPRVAEEGDPEPHRSVAGAPIPDVTDPLADAHLPSPQSVATASSPADIGGTGFGKARLYLVVCAALIAHARYDNNVLRPLITSEDIRPTEKSS
jgi:hypothetical protein